MYSRIIILLLIVVTVTSCGTRYSKKAWAIYLDEHNQPHYLCEVKVQINETWATTVKGVKYIKYKNNSVPCVENDVYIRYDLILFDSPVEVRENLVYHGTDLLLTFTYER